VTALLVAAAAPALALAQSTAPALFIGHYHTTTAGVSSFLIDPADGTVQFVQRVPTGQWTSAIALSPDGRHLAAAHRGTTVGSRDISIFRVNPDATLTLAGSGLAPESVMTMAWVSDHVLAIARTNEFNSGVGTYHFNEATGTLSHISIRASGQFTQSIVYIEPYLYSNSPLGTSSRIMRWSLGPTGILTFEEEIDTGIMALNMAANHIRAGGPHLYGAGGISGNRIAGLSVGEVMNWLPGAPYASPGQSPSQVVLTRDDQFLFAAHGTDDTVRSFAIAPDGSLTSLGYTFSLAPTTGSVGNIATYASQAGQTLYVTDKWITAAAIHIFRVNPDGSFAQIQAVPESGGGRRPEGGIAVWVPPERVCYANCDGSTSEPILTVDDFICFINEFAAAQALPPEQQVGHYANCDGSTALPVLTVDDFICFINEFAKGCP
jgi:6-phosphogluconolactonase (cycloisomerase 2 family)